MGIARVLERAPGITPVLERDLGDMTWSKSLASIVLVSELSVRADPRRSLHTIRRKFKKARILVHGTDAEPDIAQLLAEGADGYFSLSLGEEKLIKAIRVLERGSLWLPEIAVASVVSRLRSPATPPLSELSAFERALLQMLDQGLSNKEMAARAGLAEVTIKARLARLYRRFNVRTRVQLLSAAIHKGLLQRH